MREKGSVCMCQSVWVSVFMRPMLISHTAFPFLLFWTNHLPVSACVVFEYKGLFLKAILMHVHFSCCKRCIKMLWSVKCASLPSLSHHYFARPRTYPSTFVGYMVNYEWMCHGKASNLRLGAGFGGEIRLLFLPWSCALPFFAWPFALTYSI